MQHALTRTTILACLLCVPCLVGASDTFRLPSGDLATGALVDWREDNGRATMTMEIDGALETVTVDLHDVDPRSLPMYGTFLDRQMTPQEDAAHHAFIEQILASFDDRATASRFFLQEAAQHAATGAHTISMNRLNQAWLLDSTNADVYAGFGEAFLRMGLVHTGLAMLTTATTLDPTNVAAIGLRAYAHRLHAIASDQSAEAAHEHLATSMRLYDRCLRLSTDNGPCRTGRATAQYLLEAYAKHTP
jgi:hypothetical protein